MDKQELRRQMLAKRRAVSAEEQAAASASVCAEIGRLLAATPHKDGAVLSYLAYGRELDLSALHRRLWQEGAALAVPVTEGLPPGVMRAAAYLPRTRLQKTALGVWEPAEPRLIAPEDIGVVIAPGVAFSQTGDRLGHGMGYYDRYLAELPAGVLVIGAAYRWQLVESLPTDAFDRRMDMVVCD